MEKSKMKYQKCGTAGFRQFLDKFLNFAFCALIFELSGKGASGKNAKVKNEISKLWNCRPAAMTSSILHFAL
jgi:hypothetical protein